MAQPLAHSFDEDIWDDAGSEDSNDDRWGECSDDEFRTAPATPTSEFIKFVSLLLMTRVLNAKQFCILMYWAWQAGIGACTDDALPPNSKSGHYQRKLDKTFGTGRDNKLL